MKIVQHKLAEDLVKIFVPENILNLKPIIAGGFIVDLYKSIIKNAEAQKSLEEYLSRNSHSNMRPTLVGIRSAIGKPKYSNREPLQFGDIDLWFQDTSKIWDSNNEFHFLVSSERNPQKYSKIYPQPPHEKKYEMDFLGINSDVGCIASTKWANTYYLYPNLAFQIKLQAIKKSYKDVEELFQSFDILNCCAAYHDGKFYFAEGFEDSFEALSLEKGCNFNKDRIQERIWGANRAFKYAKRYDLEFCTQICEDMVQIFVEAEEFFTKLSESVLSNTATDEVVSTELTKMEDGYGQSTIQVTKETMLSMTRLLFSYFPELILMKNFNKEYIFAFLNSKDPSIMHEVRKYIELQERLSRGEGEAKETSWSEDPYRIF